MSRNGSGTYTLPSGNPVVSGTLIEATWANTTLSDLASAMTDSLSRSGQGGMTAALRLFDGTSSVPGLAWGSETTTGWYRAGAGDMRLVITGSQVIQYLSTGVAVTGTLSVSGNTTLSGGTANGVAYLNGSKVLTTGSALTFDGTNLGVGGSVTSSTGASTNFTVNGSSTASAQFGIGGAVTNYIFNDSTRMQVWANGASTALQLGTGQNNPITFFQNNSEQMRLTSTGLGIGTSSPAEKLQVVGKILSTGDGRIGVKKAGSDSVGSGPFFSLQNADASREWFNQLGASNSLDWWFYNGSSYTKQATLDSSGNLGLGVTPSAWLSSFKALQVGTAAVSQIANRAYLTANWFANSSGTDTYIASDFATMYRQQNGQHHFLTAPSGTAGNAISFTQAMTLDASGNLGVGTTSPGARIMAYGASGTAISLNNATTGTTTASGFQLQTGSGGDAYVWNYSNSFIAFGTNNTERARIDSSGNLLVGTTSTTPNPGIVSLKYANGYVLNVGHASTAVNGEGFVDCFYNGNNIGGIRQSGTTGVSYATSSDYRLKENIQPMTGALAKIAALKPCTYKWKVDGSDGQGFIAHELQDVCPDAVVGEKDAVDAEGQPQYQGIDTSFLVATLTAAIQEQQAIINQLKADVAALKGA